MRFSLLILSALFGLGLNAQTTFNVDMSCAPEGFTDVFVTGPWCGWCANDVYNTMTDDDGDGIYTVAVTIDGVALGDLVEYKYAINGFDDQENLINDMVDGASCAPVTDFAGYANRQIPAGDTANDSYGTCDGTCNDAPAAVDRGRDLLGRRQRDRLHFHVHGGNVQRLEQCSELHGRRRWRWHLHNHPCHGARCSRVQVLGQRMDSTRSLMAGDACTSTIDGYTNRV